MQSFWLGEISLIVIANLVQHVDVQVQAPDILHQPIAIFCPVAAPHVFCLLRSDQPVMIMQALEPAPLKSQTGHSVFFLALHAFVISTNTLSKSL